MDLHLKDIRHILAPFSSLEDTTAIAVGGSFATGLADNDSDVDIYVYSETPIPIDYRKEVSAALGRDCIIDGGHADPSDQWYDRESGYRIDLIYRQPRWMMGEIRRILVERTPSLGWSTCVWDSLLYSTIAYDPTQWLEDLKKTATVPYPVELQKAIILHNRRALKNETSGLIGSLAVAARRRDLPSLGQRMSALLASCFDIVFAANKVTNPGEKRILDHVRRRCKRTPRDFRKTVEGLISSIAGEPDEIIENAGALVDSIEAFLEEENMVQSLRI